MKKRSSLALACLAALGCRRSPPPPPPPPPAIDVPVVRDAPPVDAGDPNAPRARLEAFGSRDALVSWLRARHGSPRPRRGGGGLGTVGGLTGSPGGAAAESAAAPVAQAAPPPAAAPAPAATNSASGGTGSGYGSGAGSLGLGRAASARRERSAESSAGPGSPAGGADSITNNQVEGVDEGDIVKMHGQHLVVLRRGRLFSVRLGDDRLTPVSMVDAYGRGRQPGGWYDEMLVDGNTIVVIGYSYRARASEVGLFDIDAEGNIRWRDTLFVRSSDYYSSRNYASRLVGHHLVMYMPVPLRFAGGDDMTLPAIRHTPDGSWETVMDYARLYRPVQDAGWSPVIHTVMSCDLSGRGFNCRTVGVVGPSGRNFYVSGSAVYLWVNGTNPRWRGRRHPVLAEGPPPAVMYRMPLDCSAIGAVKARGAPLDQFSFDERGDTLRVVVRAQGSGDAMWGSETTAGDLGFLRVPLARFSEEVPTMEGAAYRGLPRIEGNAYSMQNRFVGDYLLYGMGAGWRGGATAGATHPVQVFDVARDRVTRVEVSHSVERLEPIGRDALAVGNEARGLTFSAIALDETPTLAGTHTVRGASQGESRSHGFFYSPSGDREGTLGLPVTQGADGGGWSQLRNVSSSVLFLGVNALRFRQLGSLRSGREAAVDDHCVASCADWYGNARPIFWRGRVFALLGYELVEGTVGATVRELRRVNFHRALLDTDRDRSGNVFNNLPD
ncbi:MAG: beta-propeller domain-containing protein [Polyangiales bacterium]